MQTMKCLLVCVAFALVACASAQPGRKNDSRPVCFRDMTEDEHKEKMAGLKTCKDSLTEDDKKDFHTKIRNVLKCYMKAKNMINDNDEVVEATVEEKIEKFGIEEFKPALKELMKKCIATPKCEDFFKCIKDNKKDLPCRCPHHHHRGHKGMDKKGPAEGDLPADGDIPV